MNSGHLLHVLNRWFSMPQDHQSQLRGRQCSRGGTSSLHRSYFLTLRYHGRLSPDPSCQKSEGIPLICLLEDAHLHSLLAVLIPLLNFSVESGYHFSIIIHTFKLPIINPTLMIHLQVFKEKKVKWFNFYLNNFKHPESFMVAFTFQSLLQSSVHGTIMNNVWATR